jgi:hypothetical protein
VSASNMEGQRLRRLWPLWVSLVVTVGTAAIHILAGTPQILSEVAASGMSAEATTLSYALWHLTSVLLIMMAAAIWWVGHDASAAARPLLVFVWLIDLAFLVIMLGLDLATGAVFTPLIQWVLFAPVAILLPLVRLNPRATQR